MLILSRKLNEEIHLSGIGDVRIVVVGLKGDKVRLGIDAPPEVQVQRPDAKCKTPRVGRADEVEAAN